MSALFEITGLNIYLQIAVTILSIFTTLIIMEFAVFYSNGYLLRTLVLSVNAIETFEQILGAENV